MQIKDRGASTSNKSVQVIFIEHDEKMIIMFTMKALQFLSVSLTSNTMKALQQFPIFVSQFYKRLVLGMLV